MIEGAVVMVEVRLGVFLSMIYRLLSIQSHYSGKTEKCCIYRCHASYLGSPLAKWSQ